MRDMTDQSHHFQSIRDGIGRAVASHLRFKFKDGRAATAGVTCCYCGEKRHPALFSQLALTTGSPSIIF